jgi:histidine phosphotransferase ChpT
MTDPSPTDTTRAKPSCVELSATVAAKLCHDFISPASAIVSGVDLLDDPESQDMREDALSLIADSARKLAAHLAFARVAFGASAAADTFDSRDLKALVEGVFAHVRPDLDWAVGLESVQKPVARALLNLSQIGAGILPTGGLARLVAGVEDGFVVAAVEAEGAKVRLRPEVAEGLRGEALGDGLPGYWVQAYFLSQLVAEAGGTVDFAVSEERVVVRARLPA